MLRPLVCTMHFMKRYWILKPDKGLQSQLCNVMCVSFATCIVVCCVLFAFVFPFCLLGLVVLWVRPCETLTPFIRDKTSASCLSHDPRPVCLGEKRLRLA